MYRWYFGTYDKKITLQNYRYRKDQRFSLEEDMPTFRVMGMRSQ